MSPLSVGVGLLVGILTVAGLLGAAWPYFRGKQAEAYTDLLEKALAAERTERALEATKAQREATEAEHRCNEQIAELRGRVATLTEGFAGTVGEAVVAVVKPALEEALRR